jgi:hypothetical protein
VAGQDRSAPHRRRAQGACRSRFPGTRRGASRPSAGPAHSSPPDQRLPRRALPALDRRRAAPSFLLHSNRNMSVIQQNRAGSANGSQPATLVLYEPAPRSEIYIAQNWRQSNRRAEFVGVRAVRRNESDNKRNDTARRYTLRRDGYVVCTSRFWQGALRCHPEQSEGSIRRIVGRTPQQRDASLRSA